MRKKWTGVIAAVLVIVAPRRALVGEEVSMTVLHRQTQDPVKDAGTTSSPG